MKLSKLKIWCVVHQKGRQERTMTERDVWYYFAKMNGDQYKNLRLHRLKYSEDKRIVDFRAAVHAANADFLQGFVSSHLSVKEERVQNELKLDALVGKYGMSMENPLVLVVPDEKYKCT